MFESQVHTWLRDADTRVQIEMNNTLNQKALKRIQRTPTQCVHKMCAITAKAEAVSNTISIAGLEAPEVPCTIICTTSAQCLNQSSGEQEPGISTSGVILVQ